LHLEGDREAFNGFQSNGALCAFDEADVSPMKLGRVGQRFLGEVAGFAKLSDSLTELLSKLIALHA